MLRPAALLPSLPLREFAPPWGFHLTKEAADGATAAARSIHGGATEVLDETWSSGYGRDTARGRCSHDRMDALQAVHGAGGLGMPPPEKFRSGPLPRASVPLHASASSASDMDESSDVEEEVGVCSGSTLNGRNSSRPSSSVPLRVPTFHARELARVMHANGMSGAESPRHEAAALRLQKVYKSFRAQWQLADAATIVGKGLSKDDKAQKLALQHWLEVLLHPFLSSNMLLGDWLLKMEVAHYRPIEESFQEFKSFLKDNLDDLIDVKRMINLFWSGLNESM
ncbi:hypothetical protein ACQ4PT_054551 [Festuca glaucescens]